METVIGSSLPTRWSNLPRRPRGPDRLVLNSPIQPMKWDHPLTDTFVPGPDAAQSIIDRRNPFNKRDTSVTNMYELYPTTSNTGGGSFRRVFHSLPRLYG